MIYNGNTLQILQMQWCTTLTFKNVAGNWSIPIITLSHILPDIIGQHVYLKKKLLRYLWHVAVEHTNKMWLVEITHKSQFCFSFLFTRTHRFCPLLPTFRFKRPYLSIIPVKWVLLKELIKLSTSIVLFTLKGLIDFDFTTVKLRVQSLYCIIDKQLNLILQPC